MATPDGGDDLIWIGGPSERPWIVVGLGEKAVGGGLEVDDRLERAAFDPSLGKLGEEPSTALGSLAETSPLRPDAASSPRLRVRQLLGVIGLNDVRQENACAEHSDHCGRDLNHLTRPYACACPAPLPKTS